MPPDATNKECDNDSTNYSSNSSLYFLDRNGEWFGYLINGSALASASATLASINLNSAKTRITGFSIACSRTYIHSQPSVTISFDIEFCSTVACDQTRTEEISTLHYNTRIKLRNY